jgi:hypothetical protein
LGIIKDAVSFVRIIVALGMREPTYDREIIR